MKIYSSQIITPNTLFEQEEIRQEKEKLEQKSYKIAQIPLGPAFGGSLLAEHYESEHPEVTNPNLNMR